MSQVMGIQPDMLDKCWGLIEPYIEEMLNHDCGRYHVEDIKSLIERAELQLWALPESVVLTQVVDFPRKRILRIFGMAGEIQDAGFIEFFKEFGREHGCDMIEETGRPGWDKALKPYGLKREQTVLRAEL